MFTNLQHWLKSSVGPKAARARRRRFRPEVLPLEERAVPSVTLVNEVEGNNTPAQATPLPTAGGLVIASGAIQSPGDVDYYSFTTSKLPYASQVWAFVDTGGDQAPGATSRHARLTVLDSNGTTVLEQDDQDGTGTGGDGTTETGDSPVIANRGALDPGHTYFLRVEDNVGTGVINPYKLFVRVTSPWATGLEPDNTPAQAHAFDAQAMPVYEGAINSLSDVDYYRVDARAGDVLFIAADNNPGRTSGLFPNLVVTLTRPDGTTPLVSADSSTFSTSTINPAAEGFDFVVPTTGSYYVTVKQHAGSFGFTGNYHLLVTGNNEPGAFRFSAPSYTTAEGDGAMLTINRVAGSMGMVSVNYAVSAGTATAGADFTSVSGTLTFADGETSKTIAIPVNRDTLYEGSENFVVTLSNPTGGATVNAGGTAVVTITNDAPPLSDVTPLVGVTRGRVRFNPATGRFRQRVTLRNLSGQVLQGPLWLVLDHLTRKVRLSHATGFTVAHGTPGSPVAVANLADPGLMPGGSFTLMLDFASPQLRKVRYTPLVLQGLGLL